MTGDAVRIIITEDGSPTLFFEEYDQAMHTLSGAYTESLVKHVHPSNILESREDALSVLDIGFGLGYNILALLMEMKKEDIRKPLSIVSLEKDRSYAPFLKQIHFDDEREILYDLIRNAFRTGHAREGSVTVRILFGDARRGLAEIEGDTFDAVFHDPFSPSKNPELWSVEFFSKVRTIMKENAVLTTYSSAAQVRMAMLEAGFFVGRGPSMGRKREGTIASPGRIITTLDTMEIQAMRENYKSTPYRDPGLHAGRDEILKRRLDEMQEIRVRAYRQAHQK